MMKKSLKVMLYIMMIWNIVSLVLGIMKINIPEIISITVSLIVILMGICVIWNNKKSGKSKKGHTQK